MVASVPMDQQNTQHNIHVYVQLVAAVWMIGVILAYWLLHDRIVVPLVGILRDMALFLLGLLTYS
jgi:hypothetical protein